MSETFDGTAFFAGDGPVPVPTDAEMRADMRRDWLAVKETMRQFGPKPGEPTHDEIRRFESDADALLGIPPA